MKNRIVFRLFTLLFASALLFSCSKENLIENNKSITASTEINKPIPFTGGIAGTLVPVPDFAVLKIYNDEQNFGTYCYPDPNGDFKITDLAAGIYRIMIIYIPDKKCNDCEYLYYEIPRILVEPPLITELGKILLWK